VIGLQWLLFQYNVPNKPSKLRVYIWRKLKALRAEQLLEGLYALPLTDKTTEQFEWLCAEVFEMDGTAVLWKADCLSEIQEMLSQKPDEDQQAWLDAIVKMYADIRFHDYFDTQQKYTIHTQIERHYLKNKNGSDSK
jgi:hypothetical protein